MMLVIVYAVEYFELINFPTCLLFLCYWKKSS